MIEPIISKEKLIRVSNSLIHGNPLLFIGPTGCGKSVTAKYLAEKFNQNFVRIEGSTNVSEFDLLGSWGLASDGSTYWRDGVLTTALREGYWVLFEEINAIKSGVLLSLNSLLEGSNDFVLKETGESIKVHPNFRLIASMNPSSYHYSGTLNLNASILDRFTVVSFDYLNLDDELNFILNYFGYDNASYADTTASFLGVFVTTLNSLRKNLNDNLISTRFIINIIEDLHILPFESVINEYKSIPSLKDVLLASFKSNSVFEDTLLESGKKVVDYNKGQTYTSVYQSIDENLNVDFLTKDIVDTRYLNNNLNYFNFINSKICGGVSRYDSKLIRSCLSYLELKK